MEDQSQYTDSNPFKNRNAEEVWKELLKNSKPISRAEAHQKMREAILKHKTASQSK